jgi:phasin family protein
MNNTSNNPFMDSFKAFVDPSAMQGKMSDMMDNMKKMSENCKMPGNFDMSAMANQQKRNVEAMTKINKAVTETMQSVMKRQSDIMQANVSGVMSCAKSVHTTHSKDKAKGQHVEFAKDALDTTLSNMRDTVEVTAKLSMEVFDICSERMSEMMHEVTGNCQKSEAAKA